MSDAAKFPNQPPEGGTNDATVGKWVSAAFQLDFDSLSQADQEKYRAQYRELAQVGDDSYTDDDIVAEWVGLHYGRNFDHMSEDDKQDYRDRYVEMHSPE